MPKSPTLTEAPSSQPGAIIGTIYVGHGGPITIRTQLVVTDAAGNRLTIPDEFLANDISEAEAGITNAQRNAYLTAIYTKAVARWQARSGVQ